MSNQDRLVEAANAFLEVSSDEEAADTLQKYPELLSNEINFIFEDAIENSRKNNELKATEFFEQRYQMLQTLNQSLSKKKRLIEAVNTFLDVPILNTKEMATVILLEYPELLLEEEINIIFENAIENARQNDELEKAEFFEQRYQILQTLNQSLSKEKRLIEAADAFLNVSNEKEMEIVFQSYPELLSNEINIIFENGIRNARENNELEKAEFFEQKFQTLKEFKIRLQVFMEHPLFISNQAINADECFRRTKNIQDLNNAISLWEKSLELYMGILSGSADSYYLRYKVTSNLDDLNIAISRWESSIQMSSSSPDLLSDRFNNLGNGLVDRYKHSSNLEDLHAGITAYQQAVNNTSSTSYDNILDCKSNLASSLRERYECLRNIQDLEDAIKIYEELIIAGIQNNISYISGYFNNLGNALWMHFLIFNNKDDLERAISAYEQAVITAEKNDTNDELLDLPMFLNNLGLGLRERYLYSKNIKDLQTAINSFQRSLDIFKKDAPDSLNLLISLNNLAVGLFTLYEYSNELDDLKRAIKISEEIITFTQKLAPNSPTLCSCFNNLGANLSILYKRLSHIVDLNAGVNAFKQAVQLGSNAPIADLLMTARNWLNWAFERNSWEEMEESYPSIQNASRSLVGKQLLREHQEAFLKETQGIASKVTYSQIQRNDLKQAVEALEQGAARLLTIALLKTISADVEHNINIIFKTAQTHPLIYIFSTDKGGYTLVVFQNDIKTIALPELKNDLLDKKLQAYFDAYNLHSKDFKAWQAKIEEITNWLWEIIWQPLIELLPKEQTKITLIPNGLLNLLPLHLAWTQKGDKKNYVLDKFVINYAPNALSLETAKQRASLKPDKLLAIDDPLNKLKRLNYSNIETTTIAKHFNKPQLIPQHNATLENVKSELEKDYNVLHFSCHGTAELRNPLETGLCMVNYSNDDKYCSHKLTVQDFLNAKLNARLVTLSACETGMIGIKLPEEVVNLPASLLQAGVAGVVASLWAVNDFSTALLMIKFYENFAQQPDNIALSLQQAQHWLRDSTNKDFLKYIEDHQLSLDATQKRPFRKNNPQDKPFQHCYYWGAFYVTGV